MAFDEASPSQLSYLTLHHTLREHLPMSSAFAPLVTCFVLACGQNVAALADPAPPRTVAEAIQQLGDRKSNIRQRASEYLIQAGRSAQAEIERATKSDDPEVSQRAKAILRRLVRPPTAPPQLEQLERDFLDSPSRRSSLVWRLADPSEFALVSKLIGSVKDLAERKSLEESFQHHIANVAHQLCQEGYIDEAERVLGAAVDRPEIEAILFAVWLEFDRMTERVSKAEQELAGKPNPAAQQRLARMWRAAGNRAKAREVATQAKDYEYAMWLAAETGDWSAALRAHELSREGKRKTFGEARLRMLFSHFAGDNEKSAESAKTLYEFIQAKSQYDSVLVPALITAERYEMAIELLEAGLPSKAFALHCLRHDYDRAFALAKVSPGAEINAAWYQVLPDTLPPDRYGIARRQFASDIAIALNSVGRRDDALRVIAVMHEVLDAQPRGDEMGMIVRTWLAMGDRPQAIAETILAADAETRRPRPPVPPGVPTGSRLPGWWIGYLYPMPQTDLVRGHVWPKVDEHYGHDHRKVFAVLESHFDPPTRARLTADQRVRLLDELELMQAQGGLDRQAEWLRKVAEVAEFHGDQPRAVRLREYAHRLAQRSPAGIGLRGIEAYTRRDWPEAVQWLRRDLERYPNDSTRLMRLGVSLIASGRHEEGEALIARSSKLGAGPTIYAGQGHSLLAAGFVERGIERFGIADRLLPPDHNTVRIRRNSRAYSLKEVSPLDAAKAWQLNSLIAFEIDIYSNVEDYLDHGRPLRESRVHDLLKLGKATEAAAEVKRGLEIAPGDVELVTAVVPAFDAAGQRTLGDELFTQLHDGFTKLCNAYPHSIEHRRLLAVASARCSRRLDDALQRINEAIELNPQASTLRSALARVLLARGDTSAAREAALAGVSLDPSDSDCRAMLAKLESQPKVRP